MEGGGISTCPRWDSGGAGRVVAMEFGKARRGAGRRPQHSDEGEPATVDAGGRFPAPGPTLPRHTWRAGVRSLEAPVLRVGWPPWHTGLLPAGGLVPGAQSRPMGEPAGGYLPLVWFRPEIITWWCLSILKSIMESIIEHVWNLP